MKVVRPFGIIKSVGDQLSSSRFASKMQLFKRANLDDDEARRALKAIEDELSIQVIAENNGRLELSDDGKELYQIALRLTALRERANCRVETLRIQADPLLAQELLPSALRPFLSLYGSCVSVEVLGLLDESIRDRIRSGQTSFGLGFCSDSQPVLPGELLEGITVPWTLILPAGHRLAAQMNGDQVSGEELSQAGFLFVPALAAQYPGLTAFLGAEALQHRVENIPAVCRLVQAEAGIGIVPWFASAACPAGIVTKPLPVPPLQVRFLLPRRGENRLPEYTQSLIDHVRQTVKQAPCLPVPEAEPVAAEPAFGPDPSDNHPPAEKE